MIELLKEGRKIEHGRCEGERQALLDGSGFKIRQKKKKKKMDNFVAF